MKESISQAERGRNHRHSRASGTGPERVPEGIIHEHAPTIKEKNSVGGGGNEKPVTQDAVKRGIDLFPATERKKRYFPLGMWRKTY